MSISNPLGSLGLAYDARGGLTSIHKLKQPPVADSPGRAAPPSRGWLATSAPLQVTNTALSTHLRTNAPTALNFDPAGNLVTVADARGNNTHYGVDDFGRRVFTRSPDTGLSLFEYDEDNNLRRKTVASGATATFDYDAANRLVAAHLEEGATTFDWRSAGASQHLSHVKAPSGLEQFDYDKAGRITRHVRAVGMQRYRTDFRYDRQGRMREQRRPDGRRLQYRYHLDGPHAGQLESIVEARRFGRDVPLIAGLNDEPPGGVVRDWIAANGITTTLNGDGGRLSRLRIDGLHDFTYQYDFNDKIVGIDDGATVKARYRFDPQGRLDFALTPAALFGYRYDTNGNRSRLILNGRHVTYGYASDNNHLTSLGVLPDAWFPPMAPDPQALFHTRPCPAVRNAVLAASRPAEGR